jgi:GNAT superfamily N-acetyltransferase
MNENFLEKNNEKDRLKEFLEKDRLQNIMAIYFLKKPTCQVLGQNEAGVYLYDSYSNISVLCADNEEAGEALLEGSSKPATLVLNRPIMLNYVKDKWNLIGRYPCFQGVFTGESMAYNGTLSISLATDEEIEVMNKTYQFADLNEFEKTRERGMLFAAHDGGKFVGYIGEHSEGSMGMLHILEPYRGRGYAYMLESFLIGEKLKRGQIPYCHIIEDNVASYHLQQKLGLKFAKDKIIWTSELK